MVTPMCTARSHMMSLCHWTSSAGRITRQHVKSCPPDLPDCNAGWWQQGAGSGETTPECSDLAEFGQKRITLVGEARGTSNCSSSVFRWLFWEAQCLACAWRATADTPAWGSWSCFETPAAPGTGSAGASAAGCAKESFPSVLQGIKGK